MCCGGVLGDDKLNFLGKSYGTYLGAIYAEMFPDRVGRLVLDGVVDPAADAAALARSQAVGFERALASFVDDCLPRSNCPLSGDRAHALAQVSGILDAADRTPLRASRPVTQSLALLGVAYSMYDPALWVVLREALAQAINGQGSTLLLLADFYLDRRSKGHYPTNANDALFAVTCLDRGETSDLAALRARAKEFKRSRRGSGRTSRGGSCPVPSGRCLRRARLLRSGLRAPGRSSSWALREIPRRRTPSLRTSQRSSTRDAC